VWIVPPPIELHEIAKQIRSKHYETIKQYGKLSNSNTTLADDAIRKI